MEIVAKLNNLRISPRKLRLLADMIRGKKIEEARAFLVFSVKRGALPLKKLLDSALANAKNNFQLKEENLSVVLIKVDESRKLKRWRARARGRACRIEKKTSNITLVLGEKQQKEKEKIKVEKENNQEVKQEVKPKVKVNEEKKPIKKRISLSRKKKKNVA